MARIKEKNKALRLRLEGKSINEIALGLNIAKSTVSLWCRDVKLGPSQIKRLAGRQEKGSYRGRMRFLEKLRRQRIKETTSLQKEGEKEVGILSRRNLFLVGIALYWSEGYTYTGGEQVGFTNSDPKMILLMLRWFKEICGIPIHDITLQIKINKSHKNRIRKIEDYWATLTGVPNDQFNKTVLIKSRARKVYSNPETYYGTLRITVRRGTRLRRKIMGWISGLARARGRYGAGE